MEALQVRECKIDVGISGRCRGSCYKWIWVTMSCSSLSLRRCQGFVTEQAYVPGEQSSCGSACYSCWHFGLAFWQGNNRHAARMLDYHCLESSCSIRSSCNVAIDKQWLQVFKWTTNLLKTVFVNLGGVQLLHLMSCSAHLWWLEAQSSY